MTISKVNAILDAALVNNAQVYEHLERTALYTFALAKALKMEPKHMEQAYFAGLLHGIGKIEQPSHEHVIYGSLMVKFVDGLEYLSTVIKHQHENWDGTGYPSNLYQDQIPLLSRIVAIACAYDNMRNVHLISHEEAVEKLKKGSGTLYDPGMIEPFVQVIEAEELV